MLLKHGRACPRGHENMVEIEGLYGLPQFVSNQNQGLLQGTSAANGPDVLSTGRIYTVNLYLCQTCGTVEMVDSGS